MFALFNAIITVVLGVIDNALGTDDVLGTAEMVGVGPFAGPGVLGGLYALAVLLPSLAVAVRRLHDTDRSGWWLLIGIIPLVGAIVLLVLFVTPGTRGPNQHGADPKVYAATP